VALLQSVYCSPPAHAKSRTNGRLAHGKWLNCRSALCRRATGPENSDYVTAEREYRAVLEIRPDFAEVHMNLGLVYQLQDQISDAMIEFRRALHLKPTLAGANFFLGIDYCKTARGLGR